MSGSLSGRCGAGLVLAACLAGSIHAATRTQNTPMDAVTQSYVRLVLGMGLHDQDYVDAYYGPPEWKKEVEDG